MAKAQYNADSITVLEGLEAVRKRPGMYIGGVGTKGLNHFDIRNRRQCGGRAPGRILYRDHGNAGGGRILYRKDNGRGIPVEMHKRRLRRAWSSQLFTRAENSDNNSS